MSTPVRRVNRNDANHGGYDREKPTIAEARCQLSNQNWPDRTSGLASNVSSVCRSRSPANVSGATARTATKGTQIRPIRLSGWKYLCGFSWSGTRIPIRPTMINGRNLVPPAARPGRISFHSFRKTARKSRFINPFSPDFPDFSPALRYRRLRAESPSYSC